MAKTFMYKPILSYFDRVILINEHPTKANESIIRIQSSESDRKGGIGFPTLIMLFKCATSLESEEGSWECSVD